MIIIIIIIIIIMVKIVITFILNEVQNNNHKKSYIFNMVIGADRSTSNFENRVKVLCSALKTKLKQYLEISIKHFGITRFFLDRYQFIIPVPFGRIRQLWE